MKLSSDCCWRRLVKAIEFAHPTPARQTLRGALSKLPEDERRVLTLHYGLVAGSEPQPIEQITRSLGVSRNRVRRVEARGLARLAARADVQALH